jgi:putative SOS response-associated peptidase YedK
MCERFYLTATPADIRKHFKLDKVAGLAPRYNIAATQPSPIVAAAGKGRALRIARWGLVPPWSRDLSLAASMINARAETLEEKSTFSTLLQGQRCLVPANGFYEWRPQGAKKQPYRIALRNGGLIAFAGLWAIWEPERGEPVETFTIITTEASKLVGEVHNRMPAILAPPDYQRWLTAPAATAKRLLAPYTSGLTITPVSERVNSVHNDDVGLLAPV